MKKFIWIFTACLILISCGKKEDKANNPSLALNSANSDVASLEKRIAVLESKGSLNDLLEKIETTAFLKFDTKDFAPIKTNLGYITVNIDQISSYASGTKVRLLFGNPTSAKIKIKFQIDYGSLNTDGSINLSTEKTKSIDRDETLLGGSWNRFDIILDNITPDKFGYIRVRNLEVPYVVLNKTF